MRAPRARTPGRTRCDGKSENCLFSELWVWGLPPSLSRGLLVILSHPEASVRAVGCVVVVVVDDVWCLQLSKRRFTRCHSGICEATTLPAYLPVCRGTLSSTWRQQQQQQHHPPHQQPMMHQQQNGRPGMGLAGSAVPPPSSSPAQSPHAKQQPPVKVCLIGIDRA